MASLLPSKPKASSEEYFFENRPVYRCYSWHFRLDSDNCRASFNGHPCRTYPTSLPKFIPTFSEDFLYGSQVCRSDQEEMHGFIQSLSSLFWARPCTHDIQWHCMRDVLIPLF